MLFGRWADVISRFPSLFITLLFCIWGNWHALLLIQILLVVDVPHVDKKNHVCKNKFTIPRVQTAIFRLLCKKNTKNKEFLLTVIDEARVKIQRKLPDILAEKRKWNGNTDTKTGFCGMEMEAFMQKQKQKRNNVFRWNGYRNGNSVSVNTKLSIFRWELAQFSRPKNFGSNFDIAKVDKHMHTMFHNHVTFLYLISS